MTEFIYALIGFGVGCTFAYLNLNRTYMLIERTRSQCGIHQYLVTPTMGGTEVKTCVVCAFTRFEQRTDA